MDILIVDDHQLFLDGLRWILLQRYNSASVSYAQSGTEALAQCDARPAPDLVLLDLNLPDMGGIVLLREMRRRGILSPVLVISASNLFQDARWALDHGALGFISKSAQSPELMAAMETVLAGDVYLPPGWAEILAAVPMAKASGPSLTLRQREIVELLAQGLANKVIADRLGISENTLKVHLREIFRNVGVNNRTACVSQARQLGLI